MELIAVARKRRLASYCMRHFNTAILPKLLPKHWLAALAICFKSLHSLSFSKDREGSRDDVLPHWSV
jgi:hypothetical protein